MTQTMQCCRLPKEIIWNLLKQNSPSLFCYNLTNDKYNIENSKTANKYLFITVLPGGGLES